LLKITIPLHNTRETIDSNREKEKKRLFRVYNENENMNEAFFKFKFVFKNSLSLIYSSYLKKKIPQQIKQSF
jgi:hypothetical protein